MEVQTPTAPPCWSSILKQQPERREQPPPPPQSLQPFAPVQTGGVIVGSCKSSKGIAVAVVDANAIIQGGEKLFHSADRFVSVAEVITEIRDPASRHSLNLLPFSVDTLEPSPDALKKVISFAKATGDLQTLSDVDLKLIALTYTLEAQIHGTQHLRDTPPPIHTVNVKRLPEKDLPGWGSNVPNLEEWEALEQAFDNGTSNNDSRILPLQNLNLDTNDGSTHVGSESQTGNLDDCDDGFMKPKKYSTKKKEVKIDGKKMVANGIDASQGQIDENADDWRPAVGRSTHRRFLRRKARREMSEALSGQDTASNVEDENVDDDGQCPELLEDEGYEERTNAIIVQDCTEEDYVEVMDQEMGNLEITSETNESAADMSSEQSWTLRSLSESSVACVTTDFAMQNVLLQMGLRLLAPGGMQIRELHRWVLKCHACFKVTTESGRIFCPSCGNGGTLRKVAVTVNENGIMLAARRPRISLRGTKFSLPAPQGGRDAVTKNPILREDQLPQKFLYPKTKKKNKQDDDLFIADDIFRHHSDKKAPLQPPVRKALAVFSGRRNPNDNHFAPPKR
ncbi:RNA-binding protein nob1 [Phtheirospermum japonicum]|uniref:RNA-binding protein nob1 n=1 Tax=Phtheirospermum japonicum TaxID=374723 RepID=A0A830B3I2_9LAMI|nr:RNA-binding protein nob1 [Phtheirospermum japonicum]